MRRGRRRCNGGAEECARRSVRTLVLVGAVLGVALFHFRPVEVVFVLHLATVAALRLALAKTFITTGRDASYIALRPVVRVFEMSMTVGDGIAAGCLWLALKAKGDALDDLSAAAAIGEAALLLVRFGYLLLGAAEREYNCCANVRTMSVDEFLAFSTRERPALQVDPPLPLQYSSPEEGEGGEVAEEPPAHSVMGEPPLTTTVVPPSAPHME